MATIDEVNTRVADYIAANPTMSYRVIADKLHCPVSTISSLARARGIVRRPRILTADLDLSALDGE